MPTLEPTAMVIQTFPFCGDTVPNGLRVTAGSFAFGAVSTGGQTCMADVTPTSGTGSAVRLDTTYGTSFDNPRVSIKWFQKGWWRDIRLSARTQQVPTGTVFEGATGFFTSIGYSCYYNTDSSSTVKLQIERWTPTTGGMTLDSTASVPLEYGEDVNFVLEFSLVGADLKCVLKDAANEVVLELLAADASEDAISSGGVALMSNEGDCNHHFTSFEVGYAATPSPTADPSLPPSGLGTEAPTAAPTPVPSSPSLRPTTAPTSTHVPTAPTLQPTDGFIESYEFCGTEVPSGLRVSSGSFDFGDVYGDQICLADASASATGTSSRMDSVHGRSWRDPRITLEYFQEIYHRDIQVCGRTQVSQDRNRAILF